MKRDCCKDCPDRTISCHAECEKYKAFCEANEKAKAAQRNDFSPNDLLVCGYIKRQRKVRRKDKKTAGRYRGT